MPAGVVDGTSIGVLAARTLARHRPATVLAAFDRSFYLDTGDGLIAVVVSDLHDGPINIRVDVDDMARLNAAPGQRWMMRSESLEREGRKVIDLTSASIWQPTLPREPIEPSALKAGLTRLLTCLVRTPLPDEGLIRPVVAEASPQNAVERAAKPLIKAVQDSFPSWFAGKEFDPTPALGVLGLGPGLTPSGDDLLGGALITCHRLGHPDLVSRLAAHLLPAATEATTPISRAHLAAAAEGYAAAPLHDLLDVFVNDDRRAIEQALDAIAKIGHSSGFDAIAGVVLALKAWLRIGDDTARRNLWPPASEEF